MESDILISENNKAKRKGDIKMKKILIPAGAMLVIIAVQMVLTYVFTYHVGEVFSKASVMALFYYYVIKYVKAVKKHKSGDADE